MSSFGKAQRLIEGTYAGQKDTKWVATGSHNYTNAALRENDEAMIRIQSAPIHDQYRSNFWALRAAASALDVGERGVQERLRGRCDRA